MLTSVAASAVVMTMTWSRRASAGENWLLEWMQPNDAQQQQPPSEAQANLGGAGEGGSTSFTRTRAGVFGEYSFETEIDETGNGDVSVFRAGAGFQIATQVFDHAQLGFDFLYEFADFDFSGPNTMIAGTNDPFSELHLISIGSRLVVPVDERWSWSVGVGGQFAGEADVDVSDAASMAGLVAARYQVDPDLAVSLGIVGGTQIEDDAYVLPTFTVDWKIDDAWSLRVARPFLTLGPRAELSYQLSESTSVGVGFMYRNERYRLDDDSIRRSSVVEETRLPIFVNLVTRPNEHLTLAVEGGVQAFQEIQIENREGKNGREFDVNPAPFAGVRLIWSF